MARRLRVAVAVAAVFFLAAGVVVAWDYWPPALHYRQARLLAAGRARVGRYLAGRDSLGVAAHRLATITQHYEELEERLGQMATSGPSTMVIKPLNMTPAGTDPRDPRVDELFLNAARFTVPESASPAFKAQFNQVFDSLIHARGYRVVP